VCVVFVFDVFVFVGVCAFSCVVVCDVCVVCCVCCVLRPNRKQLVVLPPLLDPK